MNVESHVLTNSELEMLNYIISLLAYVLEVNLLASSSRISPHIPFDVSVGVRHFRDHRVGHVFPRHRCTVLQRVQTRPFRLPLPLIHQGCHQGTLFP